MRFTGSFVPQQMVSVDGSVWVLGSVGSNSFEHCELDDLGPTGSSQRLVAIPTCAVDMTVGNGIIYLLVQQGWVAESNIRQMHVASFDPQKGMATVMTPTVMGIVGSGIAHTAFSYGEGSLWLYGYNQAVGGPSVVRISRLTGQPLATVTSVPAIGGLFPSVVANPDGAWFAGGPGGSPDLVELPTGSSVTRTAYAAPPRSAVVWLAAVHGAVWAEIADYGNGPKPSFRTRLDSFDETAHRGSFGPAEAADFLPLVATSNGRLWTLSFPRQCAAGVAELGEVDPASGAVSGVARLPVSSSVCENGAENESSIVTVGRNVFLLIPAGQQGESLLYRVRT